MLTYCRENKESIDFVVVYSVNRFAREKYDHNTVRAYLSKLGITLRSVTEPIDDSSTGKLMEGVLAAFAQFDNDVRGERTAAGLRAAKEKGRWPHPAPIGYLNVRRADGTKSIDLDPERATLIQEAFHLAATGKYSLRQISDRLYNLGLRIKRDKKLSAQTLGPLLRKMIYKGMVPDRPTGQVYAGDFEPLVDGDTFDLVQARLTGKRINATAYRRNHPEFPLRVFVRCGHCGEPLTGSKSRGRSKQYSYYHCRSSKKKCPLRFDIRKERLEQGFVDLLESLVPDQDYVRLFKEIILDSWRSRQDETRKVRACLERRIEELESREEGLVSAHLYQRNITDDTFRRLMDKLQEELTLARLELHEAAIDQLDVEAVLSFAEQSLLEAPRLWIDFDLDQKQRFQRIVFPEGL